MNDTTRQNTFSHIWAALRQPGTHWVTHLIVNHTHCHVSQKQPGDDRYKKGRVTHELP